MIMLALLIHFVAGGLLALIGNVTGSMAFRKQRQAHWTERARLLWPARVADESIMIIVPVLLHIAHALISPDTDRWWVLNDTAAFLGAGLVGYVLDRAVFPWLDLSTWRHLAFAGLQTRFLVWMVPVFIGIAMPVEPGWEMLLITTAYLAFRYALHRGMGLWLLSLTGHVRDARPRLVAIVANAAASSGIRPARVRELRSAGAQAYALISTNELLFTDRLIDLCSDDELTAITHHELAHLTEPSSVILLRYLGSLSHLPLLFIAPLIHTFDLLGLIIAVVLFVAIRSMLSNVSQRMEKQADRQATEHEPDKGSYARALCRIHEFNLIPAVTRRSGATHPDLYDRMVAAGLTPDFERPVAPATQTVALMMYAILLGMGFMVLMKQQGML